MSVSTTSGGSVVDRGEQRVVVARRRDDLDVGLRVEQADDAFAHEVVVLGDDDPDRHPRRLREPIRPVASSLRGASCPRLYRRMSVRRRAARGAARRSRCSYRGARAARRPGARADRSALADAARAGRADQRATTSTSPSSRAGTSSCTRRSSTTSVRSRAARHLPRHPRPRRLPDEGGLRPRVPDRRGVGDRVGGHARGVHHRGERRPRPHQDR